MRSHKLPHTCIGYLVTKSTTYQVKLVSPSQTGFLIVPVRLVYVYMGWRSNILILSTITLPSRERIEKETNPDITQPWWIFRNTKTSLRSLAPTLYHAKHYLEKDLQNQGVLVQQRKNVFLPWLCVAFSYWCHKSTIAIDQVRGRLQYSTIQTGQWSLQGSNEPWMPIVSWRGYRGGDSR